MKVLIVIGLLILAVNAMVVLMVGVVLLVDWYRGRKPVEQAEEDSEDLLSE